MQFGSARRRKTAVEGLDLDPWVFSSDLPDFHIYYNLNYLRKLWKAGKFPQPIKFSANRLAWRRSWLLEFLESRGRDS